MDPATLALTAAGLVAKKALEAASGEAGKTGWQALGRIAQTIRGWFTGDQEATETLDRLEAKPESQARALELAEVLQPRRCRGSLWTMRLDAWIWNVYGALAPRSWSQHANYPSSRPPVAQE